MNTNKALPATGAPPSRPSLRSTTPLAPSVPSADSVASVPGDGHVEFGKRRMRGQARPLFDPSIVRRAIADSFRKLDPRHQVRNPVMFVVEVGSVLTTGLFLQALAGKGEAPAGFILAIS